MKIRKYFENGIIEGLYLCIATVIYRLVVQCYVLYNQRFGKLNSCHIVFTSTPDYSDNSRALSDFLVNNGYLKKYKIYWIVNHAEKYNKEKGNSKIVFLEKGYKYGSYSLSSLKIILKAGMLLGTHGFVWNKQKSIKGQKYIRLWHGCSFKDRTANDGKRKRQFDFALVSGPLFVDIKSYFWNVDKKYIHPLGYPRYDWLLREDEKALEFKKRLCINNEQLIIWMPTFRNDIKGRYNSIEGLSSFPLLPDDNSWKALDQKCKKLNVRIIIKTHINQKEYKIPWTSFSNINRLTDDDLAREGAKLYEFLAVTDALISDYSSVAIDYLIVNKPIAFALDDYKLYKDKRGFVFDNPLEYMPGHHLYELSDMFDFLYDIVNKRDPYFDKRIKLRNSAVTISSHYCKDIADAIGLVQ